MNSNNFSSIHFKAFSDTSELNIFATNLILDTIRKQASTTMALAGGSSPSGIYELLGQKSDQLNGLKLIYGDERFLPRNHKDRNEELFRQAFNNNSALDNTSIKHQPMSHSGSSNECDGSDKRSAINSSIKKTLNHARRIDDEYVSMLLPIDIALLGIGEDGHTASLFPENTSDDIKQSSNVITIDNASKAPKERLSLSYQCLSQARILIFLAIGANKNQALKQITEELKNSSMEKLPDTNETQESPMLPVSLLCNLSLAHDTTVYFLTDTEAAKEIKNF